MPSSSARKSMNSEMLLQWTEQEVEINKCEPEDLAFLDDDVPRDDFSLSLAINNIIEVYRW